MTDEYALVSEDEMKRLKQEVEKLKKNPLGKTKEAKDLLDSVTELNETMREMLSIFREATKKLEEETPQDNTLKKLDLLIEQNKKIASGILALADLIKEQSRQEARPLQPVQPIQPQREMPLPPLPPMPRSQPLPPQRPQPVPRTIPKQPGVFPPQPQKPRRRLF